MLLEIAMMSATSTPTKKYTLFPIRDQEAWDMYQTHLKAFWTAEECDLSLDRRDFETLKPPEKKFIKFVLAFFAAADGIVNENLAINFINEFDGQEVKAFYSIQQFIEVIHSTVYSELIDTLISDEKEKSKLFNALDTYPSIKRKADWAFKYMNREKPLSHRLFAYIFVEGLQFQTSFAAIFYFKKRNLMPGLCQQNDFVSRDEGLHAKFSALMFSRVNKETKDVVDEKLAHQIVSEVVAVEKEFMDEALDISLIGMNKEDMYEYIKFVADFFLDMTGFKKLYEVSNPFPFMEMISMTKKVNFFEHRPTEYQLASKGEFSLDMDF